MMTCAAEVSSSAVDADVSEAGAVVVISVCVVGVVIAIVEVGGDTAVAVVGHGPAPVSYTNALNPAIVTKLKAFPKFNLVVFL